MATKSKIPAKTEWTPTEIDNMLAKVCYDLSEGNLETGDSYDHLTFPDYLDTYWAKRQVSYYEDKAKEERRKQYLELKKEFDPDQGGSAGLCG